MVATREGNLKIKEILLAKNPDHFKELGSRGGKVKGRKGFAAISEAKRRAAARKGGKISRRGSGVRITVKSL